MKRELPNALEFSGELKEGSFIKSGLRFQMIPDCSPRFKDDVEAQKEDGSMYSGPFLPRDVLSCLQLFVAS